MLLQTAEPRTSRRGNFGASAVTRGGITKSCCCEGYLEFHYEDIYEDMKITSFIECEHVELKDVIFWHHLSIYVVDRLLGPILPLIHERSGDSCQYHVIICCTHSTQAK